MNSFFESIGERFVRKADPARIEKNLRLELAGRREGERLAHLYGESLPTRRVSYHNIPTPQLERFEAAAIARLNPSL